MPVSRKVGTGAKMLEVIRFAPFGDPIPVAGGKLRSSVNNTIHELFRSSSFKHKRLWPVSPQKSLGVCIKKIYGNLWEKD